MNRRELLIAAAAIPVAKLLTRDASDWYVAQMEGSEVCVSFADETDRYRKYRRLLNEKMESLGEGAKEAMSRFEDDVWSVPNRESMQ